MLDLLIQLEDFTLNCCNVECYHCEKSKVPVIKKKLSSYNITQSALFMLEFKDVEKFSHESEIKFDQI